MTISREDTRDELYLGLLSAAFADQRAATSRIIRSGREVNPIGRVMVDAGHRAHRYARAALLVNPPVSPLACGKGCGHCCWATVGVLAPEVIHLAEELRSSLPAEQFSALHDRSAPLGEQLRRMDRRERLDARVPCALLQEDSCSAYQSRPLVCRWACSPSLQACLDHLVHGTTPYLEMEDVRYSPTQESWRGLRAGLSDLGLDHSVLALNVALSIALADPEAGRRYLAGEPVFESAYLG